MRVFYKPLNLYGTPLAENDRRRVGNHSYKTWLADFSYAGERLTGTNPITDLALAKPTRRWFLAGLSPYEGVKRWQKRCAEGRHQSQHTIAAQSCTVCHQPRPCGAHDSERYEVPYVEVDQITEYGQTFRLQRSIRVF